MFTKTGIDRINSTIQKFNVVREDLMTGVAEVDANIKINSEIIVDLYNKNAELETIKSKALKVVSKIDAFFD